MGLLLDLASMMTGDRRKPETVRQSPTMPMLSSYLPYRAFDPDERLFYQRKSKGFVLELAPLIGADERVGGILNSIFSDALLPDTWFQVINYASPRISKKLTEWALPRYQAGEVFETLARHRIAKLRKGAWTSLAGDGPFNVRNFRVLISISSARSAKELIQMRDAIRSSLDSINVTTRDFDPLALIRFLDEILAPTTGAGDDAPTYSKHDPINGQCVRRDLVTRVEKNRLVLKAPSLRPTGRMVDQVPQFDLYVPYEFEAQTMCVRALPDAWAPWDGQKVIGHMFNPKLNLPCPTIHSACGQIPSSEKSSAKAGYKFTRTTSLKDGSGAKLVPKIKDQAAEWEHVQAKVRTGEKLAKCYYTVTTISPLGDGGFNSRTLKALYKASGWDLIDETHLQLPALMAAFPMTMADGLGADLERMKRFRTILSSNVSTLVPLQGEFVGGEIPHLLMIGRRGQPQFWSPFQNEAGNHNVAIAGKSGSGKSVFLQELCASFAGVKAKTIVFDDGRSFEHMAKALGGRFIEFKLSSGLSINPFKMIDAAMVARDEDYLVDCLSMLKAIISQMARFRDPLNDTERGLIDQAVNGTWEAHGRAGTIDNVIDELHAAGHHFAQDLATSLIPFSSGGTYGGFFKGEANLDMSADLTVFELSDLSSREELRAVVLTTLMFLSSQVMRKIDRKIPKGLLIDEAWQMLQGGAMAEFVEAYSRTCRKYGAALITATQSVNDYYKSPGSMAALENSDWTILLQQKGETVADLARSSRFDMDSFTEQLVRSLKRNGIDYSDLLIRGPDMMSVCRLVLDPFSGALYSSSPAVFDQIEEYIKRGFTMAAAIETVAFPDQQSLEAAE